MPARRAAFFDLDRTLLGDSSGLLIMDALNERGMISDRDQSLAEVGRRFFRIIGETRLGMEITRRSLSRMAGWSRTDLREAAARSVEKLDAAVYAEARTLINRHHEEGHLVCIATSTGRDIVEPLAERLGVDQLIATEYEEDQHGVYTGNLIGKWLWGPDKAEAVKSFADRERIDLSESYAYSDSYYDRPLLESVGYPRVVNPDPLLRAYAVRKGWPVLGFSNREGNPKHAPEPYDLIRPFAHPLLSAVNLVVEGVQLIPRDAPVILAANHRSYLDPVVLAMVASRRGRKLRFLAKKEMFEAPLVGQAMRALGQIRVDRGSGDSSPLEQAVDALGRGEAIGIFPEGTIPKGGETLEPRTGVARLAVESGATVVP
ncbi:MAG: HAD-IB family hydrolase, partial [Actinobacteria bacterium]|nr:HAD-IB family hydrolase [Actinomycetota bacterium]